MNFNIEPLTTEELTTIVENNFSAPIKERLVSNWETLITEYRDKGSLSLDSIISIIGKPPVIPMSPDTDAMLEAYNEKAQYGHMCFVLDSIISIFANQEKES